MNYGTRIIVIYVFFISFILYLVYQTMQENTDLVSENYYQQEVAYQEVINQSANYNQLKEAIKMEENKGDLSFVFPFDSSDSVSGQIQFFRPSEAKKDFIVPITGKEIKVDKSKLLKGIYKLKFTWEIEGEVFYHEQSYYVQ